jgi:hypothetical protein
MPLVSQIGRRAVCIGRPILLLFDFRPCTLEPRPSSPDIILAHHGNPAHEFTATGRRPRLLHRTRSLRFHRRLPPPARLLLPIEVSTLPLRFQRRRCRRRPNPRSYSRARTDRQRDFVIQPAIAVVTIFPSTNNNRCHHWANHNMPRPISFVKANSSCDR